MSRKPRPKLTYKAPIPDGGVVVAFIHPGQVSAYFMSSIVTLLLADRAGPQRIVGMLQEWSSANVSASRNELTRQFLDDYTADWLLWVDADMAFGHDSLDLLLAAADKDTAPVMGGLCFGMTRGQLFPTIYNLAVDPDTDEPVTVRAVQYPRDAVVRVAATGAAFLLIHRSVLAAMRTHQFNRTFPWFQETEMGGRPTGEDITFCLRAMALEVPVHVHTGVRVGHHKSHILDEDLFDAQLAAAATHPGGEP